MIIEAALRRKTGCEESCSFSIIGGRLFHLTFEHSLEELDEDWLNRLIRNVKDDHGRLSEDALAKSVANEALGTKGTYVDPSPEEKVKQAKQQNRARASKKARSG